MKTRSIVTAILGLMAAGAGACGGGGPDAAAVDSGLVCGTATCDPNASCQIVDSAPVCVCDQGFTGDGQTCAMQFAPATCAEVRAHDGDATDGTFRLFVDHDAQRPWTAYCDGMLDASQPPREYLTLPAGPIANFSKFLEPSSANPPWVITSYSQVRIDPVDLTVDITDQRFASSNGVTIYSAVLPSDPIHNPVISMPFATAMSCGVVGSEEAAVSVDLTGTPFALAGDMCSNRAGGPTLTGPVQQWSDHFVGDPEVCLYDTVSPCTYPVTNTDANGGRLALQYMGQ